MTFHDEEGPDHFTIIAAIILALFKDFLLAISKCVNSSFAKLGCCFMCGYLLFLSKILHDTKELQKEINSLAGKLDRTFAVTDELVFKVMAGDQKRAGGH